MAGPEHPLPLPANLVAAARDEGRGGWLTTLPDTVARLAATWSLTVGPPFQPGGQTAWVAPARTRDGADRVLKVAWRHPEARDEAAGLRLWAGDGAVRLFAAEDAGADTSALLLERCRPGTTLAATLAGPAQDVVVAGLLRRLWRPPPAGHGFRSLQAMCDDWAAGAEARLAAGGRPPGLDPGLARDGLALLRSLPATASAEVVLCTDLHAENVLAAERAPWLAIDPKPYAGDPTYDVLQHMLNCSDRLHADPRALVERLAGLLDLDAGRLALWLFARCVQESPGQPSLAAVAAALAPE
jgi:streptomycin 6-kinase